MPGTTFLEEEDKQLVQIAREYAERGTGRIAWKDVAQKMKRWGRSPAELAQRVSSLKRTFGTDLSKFPRSFYTPVRATRGRRSAHTLRIRQPRWKKDLQHQQESNQNHTGQITPSQNSGGQVSAPKRQDDRSVRDFVIDQARGSSRGDSTHHPAPATSSMASDLGCQAVALVETGGNGVGFSPGAEDLRQARLRSLIPEHLTTTAAEQAVASMFSGIARQEVIYPSCAPHLNAGELLPSGIAAFITAIQRIRNIGAGDVFMDIGSGVGNVVTQFALSTSVRASIGIEVRRDLVDRCNGILVEHVMQWPGLQSVEVYAEDVERIELSMIYPFSSATIVFANNLRFEPSTTNHITSELLYMTDAWVAAFTSEICPRHSPMCTNSFCVRWKLQTSVEVPVSWSSNPAIVYLYTEKTELYVCSA